MVIRWQQMLCQYIRIKQLTLVARQCLCGNQWIWNSKRKNEMKPSNRVVCVTGMQFVWVSNFVLTLGSTLVFLAYEFHTFSVHIFLNGYFVSFLLLFQFEIQFLKCGHFKRNFELTVCRCYFTSSLFAVATIKVQCCKHAHTYRQTCITMATKQQLPFRFEISLRKKIINNDKYRC